MSIRDEINLNLRRTELWEEGADAAYILWQDISVFSACLQLHTLQRAT